MFTAKIDVYLSCSWYGLEGQVVYHFQSSRYNAF